MTIVVLKRETKKPRSERKYKFEFSILDKLNSYNIPRVFKRFVLFVI